MEMIDVLKKLQEIAETKPELVKDAVDNVERTNPKIDEGAVKRQMEDDAEKMSKEEFIEKYGSAMADFWHAYNGYDEATEGKKEMKKETVKEAIQISTDSPEEASMMMQILKLAGVKPMGADMPDMEPKAEPEMDTDDAAGSMDMARMRDIVKNPEDEKQEETFANEPEEKIQDVDSLVNKHSGGLNRKKQAFPRAEPGDNPMAVAHEDRITEEELANSLRTQYESFKQAYQEAAKPDYIDLDKDGNKTEPMKKAAKDKEAKEKK